MPNDLRAWRVAALPAVAILGIALPLTFASHCEQYLYDFRAVDLLPLYATAWLILAALVVPCWLILTGVLKGLEAVRRPAAALVARIARMVLFALAATIIVATVIGCLRIWLHTLHGSLPVSADAALIIAVLAGILAGLTENGRSAMRAIMPVAAVCTAAGLLSLACLPAFGWPRGGVGSPAPASDTAWPMPPPADTGQAQLMQTATPLPAGASPVRPDIVLLTIDALSAPHMSLYGYWRPTTPQLAQFAGSAETFDRAYANANFTTPGVATILTGTLPWTNRALQLPVWPLTYTRRTSLPAVLERAGYRTGYVSTNAIAGAAKQGMGQY
ncbi:MAG: sulfatase-like hydrolase/transferase, partial [Steroidobacteraceae bacterium]